MKKIVLQKGKEKSLLRYHPWVFSGAISKKDHDLSEGDLVEVVDCNHLYLGTGYYHDGSISVKIFSFSPVNPDEQFWRNKIEKSLRFRRQMGLTDNPHTNMFRLVNGEGDALPGLIIDWFDGHIVIQFHSFGMYQLRDVFTKILKELFENQVKSIYCKSAATMPEIKGHTFVDEFLFGRTGEIQVRENGHSFFIDIEKGQKTGFFIDQRENRKLVEEYAKGRNVLNLFCYTGGFSVYALAGNAEKVHSVDISKKAIDVANRNVAFLDDAVLPHHCAYIDNVFDFLEEMPDDYYDLIILDPPAFAKHHKVKEQGIKGYRNINRKAIEKIRKGGLLFTFSCSQAISKDDFQTLLFSSAAIEGREVKVVKQLQQSVDHPISIFHPEGSYLKGFMLYVN